MRDALLSATHRNKAVISTMTTTQASDVIDWDEAMEQCGDDEEFLRELLDDLRGETDAQLAKIEEEIRVSKNVLRYVDVCSK